MKHTIRLLVIFVLFSVGAVAQTQTLESINSDDLKLSWKAEDGTIFRSNVSRIYNGSSMKWTWDNSNAFLQIQNFPKDAISKNDRSTFSFWVYNQTPQKGKMKIVVAQDDHNYYTFDFGLDFKGWRTAWVLFSRDAQKVGEPKVVNSVKLYPPQSEKTGTLFLQDVRIIEEVNPRSHMQDDQLPYVNIGVEKTANAHWSALYHFSQFKEPDYKRNRPPLSSEVVRQLDTITQREKEIILEGNSGLAKRSLSDIQKELAYWDIQKKDGFYSGRPIITMNDREIFTKEQLPEKNVKEYTNLMLSIALKYYFSDDKAEKETLNQMYITMLEYMHDQGWAYGSGLGALHHLGYNFKGYYASCLFMKEPIREAGLLEQVSHDMYWFSGLGRIFQKKEDLPHSNVDVFNTILNGMLCAVLMSENKAEEADKMHQFSEWLSANMLPQISIKGAFKPDGSVVHHATLYPAYGVGGINGVSSVVYALHGTEFQVSDEAFATFKKVLLTMHRFTNPRKWSISVSGRHPTGKWELPSRPYLMSSRSVDKGYDKDLASAYMLIVNNPNDKWTQKFKSEGIKSVKPSGHWNINYGLLDIHRRDDWLLTIRGHNRYFISHESYPGANVFGRYIMYGHLEVLFDEDAKNPIPSHFSDNGWDWSLMPGTTTLAVPVDKMRANIINPDKYSGVEEMLISEEMFAGGINLDGQGMFAMKLQGHDKYDMGDFKATKAWFTFDNLVIALGSDISNSRNDYPTKTTLFQNYLGSDKASEEKAGEFIKKKCWLSGNQEVYLDSRNIGYIIPNGEAELYVGEQKSRDQKDTKDTQGYFETFTINHGKAPKKGSYEYAMLIETNKKDLKSFAKKIKKGEIYQVEQKDNIAYRVKYLPLNMSALSLFKANKPLADELVETTDCPSLIMYKKLTAHRFDLVITDPDLAFYEGEDDSPVVDGKRQEVSIYSREWYTTKSKPSVVKLTLKGIWQVDNQSKENVQSIRYSANNKTVIYVHCKYGLPTHLKLSPTLVSVSTK